MLECMYVYYMNRSQKKVLDHLKLAFQTTVNHLMYVCWKQNSGPLEGWQVLSIIESSLWPLSLSLSLPFSTLHSVYVLFPFS